MAGNRLLAKLGDAAYRGLRPGLERVILGRDEVLFPTSDDASHVYFPEDAVASLLFRVDTRRTVEVAMEGNEAAVGLALSLGVESPCSRSVVRVTGSALRLQTGALTRCARRHDDLQRLLHQYVHALLMQVGQSGICHQFHGIEARLARWLLMTQDRVGGRELLATHASVAGLLGVRRSSISVAADGLRSKDIIGYSRGVVRILDRRRLREVSCPCYAVIKDQYDSFLD
jgi:CRP-like cAMP-binding protein